MKPLIQISNLYKRYHEHILMENASFVVSEKQKIGVIGRNGAGKSTLFKMILGEETPDSGIIRILDQAHIGYLKQEEEFLDEDTIISYLERTSKETSWACTKMASLFDFTTDEMTMRVLDFSGGYQMRIKLIGMLLKKPNLLLLDEPTNYLDLTTMILLEKFLLTYNGAYLIISHDKQFLENVCPQILEIEHGRITHFPKRLSAYLEFKAQDLLTRESYNKKQNNKRKHLQAFIDRFGAKATKAAQAKSKAKQIEKIESVEVESELPTTRIRVPMTDKIKGNAIRIHELKIGYETKTVASNINFDFAKGEHIALLGNNGQGKTTFFKTLNKTIPALSGRIKFPPNMKIGYYAQHIIKDLPVQETVEKYLERYSPSPYEIYKIAGDFLFKDDDLLKQISMLSGGEKARLCLASLLLDDYDILFFDEPTNHLDFQTAEALAYSLKKSNVTIFFISHDRTFTGILADQLIEINSGRIERIISSYDDYIAKLSGIEILKEIEPTVLNNHQREYRKQLYEEDKERKNNLKKIEVSIEKLNIEQKKIFDFLSNNPTQQNLKKNQRLKEINDKIQELEGEWFVISEQIK